MKFDDKLIMYVGKKPEKRDTVTGSNMYWPGNGSVLSVEHTTALQLLRHPDVWVEVDKDGNPVQGKLQVKASKPKQVDNQEPDNEEPGESEVTVDAVKEAIFGLDRENPEHFTDGGKPKLKAVAEALGVDELDVKLVNAAWKEIDG